MICLAILQDLFYYSTSFGDFNFPPIYNEGG